MWSGPAGGVVAGLVTDECERDPVRPVGHRAGDDATVLATSPQFDRTLGGGRFVEPQAHPELDQGASQLDAALPADDAVVAFAGGLVLDRVQPGAAVDLPGW